MGNPVGNGGETELRASPDHAQAPSGLRSLLQLAWFYEMFQRLVGKNKLRRRFIAEYVGIEPGMRLVDLGCGPGDLAAYCQGAEYIGFDVSHAYIQSARRRFGDVATFRNGDVEDLVSDLKGTCDIVVMVGVLHHLRDDVAYQLVRAARKLLRPGGRFVAVEPHMYEGQHSIARALINRDRGQFVRTELEYSDLISREFNDIETVRDEHLLRVPYTLSVYTCLRPRRDRSGAED